jgi:hypothetical protein
MPIDASVVKRLAEQTGLSLWAGPKHKAALILQLIDFANTIAAHQREIDADVCEAEYVGNSIDDEGCCEGDIAYNNALKDAARAIRNLGESK